MAAIGLDLEGEISVTDYEEKIAVASEGQTTGTFCCVPMMSIPAGLS